MTSYAVWNNQLPPTTGPVLQLTYKHFRKNDKRKQPNRWWSVGLLVKTLEHDTFYLPSREEYASSQLNVIGGKALLGREMYMGNFLFEPYYGASFRGKFGTKTVHCINVLEGEPCPPENGPFGPENIFGFLPALHLGFRIGFLHVLD